MRRRTQRELEDEGFRDALVSGRPNPASMSVEVRAYYDRGFQAGKRAVERIVAEAKGATR